jgi:hypothetical protein
MKFMNDIRAALQKLPRWVQYWIAFVLVPVNLISILFIGVPGGWIVAVLAIGGIAPNAVVLIVTREFGREMAVSHLIFWPPLVVVIIWLLANAPEPTFAQYLWLLLVVDAISIGFDIRDAQAWWRTRRFR